MYACNLSTPEAEAAGGIYEFQGGLLYIVSSRTGRSMQWDAI